MYLSKLWIVCRRSHVHAVSNPNTKTPLTLGDGYPFDGFGGGGLVSIGDRSRNVDATRLNSTFSTDQMREHIGKGRKTGKK